jgi:hypothetical protein
MPFLLIFLLVAAMPAVGQPADTLYYDLNWRLTNPGEAFFYRIVHVDRAKLVFDGSVKDYLKGNNVLLLEGVYQDGRKEGRFTFYHANGQTESSGLYAADKKTGTWRHFYPDGKPNKVVRFEKTGDQSYQLWAQWDSTGYQRVAEGNGYWREYDRDVSTGRTVTFGGKVVNGQRAEAWTLEYQGGPRIYEEFFRNGQFVAGDVWDRGYKRPYSPSRLELTEPAEIQLPEFFSYDAAQFDRDYYGQGLAYFLNQYLLLGAGTSFNEASFQRINARMNTCSKGSFTPAAFPGGPLELYRFMHKQPLTNSSNGPILVHLSINDLGMVRDCYVVKGTGSGQHQKVVELMRKTRWIPATCNLTPTKSYLRVNVL